jgi:hypothetical protein
VVTRYRPEILAITLVTVALGVLGFVMNRATYEVWGGVLLIPILSLVMLPAIRWFLRKDLTHLVRVLSFGYLLKIAGTLFRYFVFAKVYGGFADSAYYFKQGSLIAASVRAGHRSIWSTLPSGRDIFFIIKLTGSVLTGIGPTRLGAFLVFGTFGYIGTVLLVVAACRSVPALLQRRYAVLCVTAPTLLFWPSSLGKEAWILLCIGGFSLGLSRILRSDRALFGLSLAIASGAGIGAVRIHLAVIFVAGAAVAFIQGLVLPVTGRQMMSRGRAVLLSLATVVVMAVLAYVAARRLKVGNPNGDFLSNLDSALNRAATMSEAGGTSFTPVNTKNPLLWPWAIFRTLTRPLPIDIKSISTLLPAAETSMFLVALIVSRQRLYGLGRSLRSAPYLTYCLVCTLLFGLVFSSFGNLGILVRQRSLIAAFMLLALCLPEAPTRAQRAAAFWASRRGDAQDGEPESAASRAW